MAISPEILFRNKALKSYFAEQLLIDAWRWDLQTYAFIDVDFSQTMSEFEEVISAELVESLTSRIATNYSEDMRALRIRIRHAAITKISYTLAGNEVFSPKSGIGPNNFWIEKSKDGITFKIGKVVEMVCSRLNGSNQKEILRLLNDESSLKEVESWLYPGVFDETEESLLKYGQALDRGKEFRDFEDIHKIPVFPEELYVDTDAIKQNHTKGIAHRIAPEWLDQHNVSQEDLMTIGIYPYCSTLVRDKLDQCEKVIANIIATQQLPTPEQKKNLKLLQRVAL